MSDEAPRLTTPQDLDPSLPNLVPVDEPVSRVTQVLPEVTPWFRASFERHAQEDVTWELGLVQFPTDSRGSFVSLIAVFTAIPGAVLGTLIQSSQQIQPYNLSPEAVDLAVREILDSLRDSRSKQIEEMTEAGKLNAQFGSKPPTNGLIIPSQR